MNMKKAYIILASALALAACANLDDAQYKKITELVPPAKSTEIDVNGGTGELIVFASGDVEVEALNDFSAYATLNKTSFKGDDTLRVAFDSNPGFRRMAKLRLVLDGGEKVDTIYFKQNGLAAHLSCQAPFGTINGSEEGEAVFNLDTDIEFADMVKDVRYLSGVEGWIRSVSADGTSVGIRTAPNTSDHISKALVRLSYVDGWDEELSVSLYITLSDKDGDFGTKIDFAAVKDLAGKGRINEDYYIKGVVISDFNSKNSDLNPSVNYDKVDISESDRTAYIQAEDGSMGLRLKYTNAKSNVLMPGTRVSLSLSGVTIEKAEDADCYTAVDLADDSIVESTAGEPVAPHVRKISELTDSDIFTWVEIPATEFVWKDASYSNVYENYALKSDINSMCSGNNNRFDGWAALLIDEDGKAIYAPINMLCTWRRNQNGIYTATEGRYGVPQGKGSVKGIIVHNNLSRYGDCGRYQIRVLDESGFCQEAEGEGIYETLAEFTGKEYQYNVRSKDCWASINSRYKKPGNLLDCIIPSDDISASNPNPKAELINENHTNSASYKNYAFHRYYAHNALVVNGTSGAAGDRGRSCNSDINDKNPCALQLNNEIKGWYKWDSDQKEITGYNGIVITTSTKGLAGSKLNVSYAFEVGRISAATSQFFPAHWCLEYSIDGGANWTLCPDAATGKEYTHLHAMPWYDINIGGIKYYSCSSCGIGATEHVSVLPDEVFGVDKLLIKLRPYDNVMSIFPMEWNGNTENSKVYPNTTADVGLNIEYIHIRYKK